MSNQTNSGADNTVDCVGMSTSLDVNYTRSALHEQPSAALPEPSALYTSQMGIIEVIQSIHGDVQKAQDTFGKFQTVANALKYEGSNDLEIVSNLLSRLEDVIALMAVINSVGDIPGLLGGIHLFIRTKYPKPIVPLLWDQLQSVLSLEFLTAQSGGGPEFDVIAGIHKCLGDWKTHREGPLARAIGNVISLLVTAGVLSDEVASGKSLTGLELFQPRIWDVQKESINFLDMVLETVLFVVERFTVAFQTGDFSNLLFSDKEIAKMDKEYTLLVSALPLLECGRLDDLKDYREEIKDASEYDARLEVHIEKTMALIRKSDKFVQPPLTAKLMVLKKLRTALILLRKKSCIRVKPLAVLIYGPSSVGKSKINTVIMKVLLDHNGFPSTKDHVVTLNDADKFQSEFLAHHNGVTYDDACNSKESFYDVAPTLNIINVLNNVPKAALKAGVEEKGNILFSPKIVTFTTNRKDLMAAHFSNEPVSILRRFDYVLDVKLRPEYEAEDGGVNVNMMNQCFIDDAWIIQLQIVRIVRGNHEDGNITPDQYEFKTVLKDATLRQVLEYLKPRSRQHFLVQQRFVDGVEAMYEQQLCPHSDHGPECPFCIAEALEKKDELVPLKPQAGEEEETDWVPLAPFERAIHELKLFSQQTVDLAQAKLESYASIMSRNREILLQGACIGGVAITAIVAAIRMFKLINSTVSPQGASMSVAAQNALTELPEEPFEAPRAFYKEINLEPIPKSEMSATIAAPRLVTLVQERVRMCRITSPSFEQTKVCLAFPIKGSTWLLPAHIFDDKHIYTITMASPEDNVLRPIIKCRVNHSVWTRLCGDFILVNLTCPPNRDLSVYLPTETWDMGRGFPATHVAIMENGPVVSTVKVEGAKQFNTASTNFYGCGYTLPYNTYDGLCMAPIINFHSVIVGFHLAGVTGKPIGAAGLLTKIQFDDAYASLGKKVLISHSEGVLNTEQYGKDFTPHNALNPRHSVNYLEEKDGKSPSLVVYGPHNLGTSSFYSAVKKSPISDLVVDELGLPREHGAPSRYKIQKHFQRDLQNIATASGDFDPFTWAKAETDMRSLFDANIAKLSDHEKKQIRPLGWTATLSGLTGVRGIDAINRSTSMGFPINKPKKNFMELMEEEVEGVSYPVDFTDPQYRAHFEDTCDRLARGFRTYTVHRANLKDEPVKFDKNKIRVFSGCQISTIIGVRKYFLPLVCYIQNNGFDFESAVGINVYGNDWDEAAKYLTTFGLERMIAGDYAAFDKSASSKALFSAFNLLLHFAEQVGYDERDLEIMRGFATEICNPLYEYDGVLLMALGSNPSGHPLTVFINNLVNSLYLRYVYYELHKGNWDNLALFASVIKLLCYGDDNAMNVSPEETLFTHTAIQRVLGEVGITYTMADKTSESVPLIPFSDVSFLKRNFRFEPVLGRFVAPIVEASLGKMLHNVQGDGTVAVREEIAYNAIVTANREYYLHGKDVFDTRHAQLSKVAQIHFGEYFELPGWDQLTAIYSLDEEKRVNVEPDMSL